MKEKAIDEGNKPLPAKDPFIEKHLNRIKIIQALNGGKRLFVECFPTDNNAMQFPNTNLAVKEIFVEAYPEDSSIYFPKEREQQFAQPIADVPNDALEDAADTYSGVMVWINPKDTDPHIFHEYISKQSFIAGANWKSKQPVNTEANDERKFSLKDLLKVYDDNRGIKLKGRWPTKEQYFKEKFNIEL